MTVADHLTAEQLRALADAEPQKRRFLRIRSVILASEGRTAPEIADVLGYSRRAVQGWVERYNKEGEAGFDDRPKPGRPSFLKPEDVDRLKRRLDAGATPEDGTCTLRGSEIRKILEAEFGVAYSLQAVYALLHRLGYSCLEPRPRHREADPAAAEAFKKKSPA